MTKTGDIVLVGMAALVVYTFLRYKLTKMIQPARLELAERGEQLLVNPRLPEYHRKVLEFMLENAYSSRIVPITIVALPILSIYLLVNPRAREELRLEGNIADADTRKEFGNIDYLFIASIHATSPLLGIILYIEKVIIILLMAAISKPPERVNLLVHKAISAEVRVPGIRAKAA